MKGKIVVRYDVVEGKNISDGECKSIAQQIADGTYELPKIFSNENIVHHLIVQMLEGKIEHDKLFFDIDDKIVEVDDLGFLIGNITLPRAQLSKELNKLRLSKLQGE